MNLIQTTDLPHLQGSSSFPDFKIFRKGDRIYSQGEISEGYYLLKKGTVKLHKKLPKGSQTIMRIVFEGEIFGDGFSNQNQSNLNSALVIEEDTLVQKLDSPKINTLEIKHQFHLQLQEQNNQMAVRHNRFLALEAEERITSLLYDLAIKKGRKFGDETLLKINLTHEEIAFLADTSRPVVSKILSSLKKSGLINYSRNRFLFRNIAQFKPLIS
ncbi:Crp/Fnr family transcriptional regulator [Algoriphagus machipongonensis]|uniref:Transcriptional regulator, Crp/Fnr family n=1 Tax=Algoriphagus machipongonensis TaxID=388413 RepID=A3I007_9BACT|nr:Crp/Fnr family transcriptional regulator [Algoriphagus machipongonensis]EAZ80843.1 putative transcriptional regulator, Crp/Fnr family [Algoriphagus machipongonensis]